MPRRVRGPFEPGSIVQTPLGKGEILEVRNRRVLVRIQDQAVVLNAEDVVPLHAPPQPHRLAGPSQRLRQPEAPAHAPGVRTRTIDLHGMTVPQALEAMMQALSDAVLDDARELRVIHGKSGGRLRAALHRHLQGLPGIRYARVDPANTGVTIIVLG